MRPLAHALSTPSPSEGRLQPRAGSGRCPARPRVPAGGGAGRGDAGSAPERSRPDRAHRAERRRPARAQAGRGRGPRGAGAGAAGRRPPRPGPLPRDPERRVQGAPDRQDGDELLPGDAEPGAALAGQARAPHRRRAPRRRGGGGVALASPPHDRGGRAPRLPGSPPLARPARDPEAAREHLAGLRRHRARAVRVGRGAAVGRAARPARAEPAPPAARRARGPGDRRGADVEPPARPAALGRDRDDRVRAFPRLARGGPRRRSRSRTRSRAAPSSPRRGSPPRAPTRRWPSRGASGTRTSASARG